MAFGFVIAPVLSNVTMPIVVWLLSGVTVTGIGVESLGPNVPSPGKWAERVYVPPGRLLMVPEPTPLAFNANEARPSCVVVDVPGRLVESGFESVSNDATPVGVPVPLTVTLTITGWPCGIGATGGVEPLKVICKAVADALNPPEGTVAHAFVRFVTSTDPKPVAKS